MCLECKPEDCSQSSSVYSCHNSSSSPSDDEFDFGLDGAYPNGTNSVERQNTQRNSEREYSLPLPEKDPKDISPPFNCSATYASETQAEQRNLKDQPFYEADAKINNNHLWILIATAAMIYTLHGFSNSVTNGIMTLNTFLVNFPQLDTIHTTGPQRSSNSLLQGMTVGIYQVGCAMGAISCFFLSDRFGRKRVIHGLGTMNVIGVVLQATAFSIPHLIVGRIVMGLGIGAGHATFPLFLAECVPSNIRGRAIIACAAAGNFGSFFGSVVELGFYFLRKSSAQWRVPLALEVLWAGAGALLPFWCVETPRFLLRKGRYEEAIKSQAKISGLGPEDPALLEQIKVLEEALHYSNADEIVNGRAPARRWYRAGMAIFIQIMSSMCGIDVITFFSTQTFQSQLHFSALIARYLTMGLQGCQWICSSVSLFLIDSIGRRSLVLAAAFIISLSMGCLSGLTNTNATEPMLKAAILFFFLVICAYPVGYHLIPAMQAAELSPGATRHQITAISGCLHFLFDFTVTLITPVAFSSINAKYYFVYMATNAFTFVVVYLLFPETKGLDLEAIDELFENAPTYLSVVNYGSQNRFRQFGKKFATGDKITK